MLWPFLAYYILQCGPPAWKVDHPYIWEYYWKTLWSIETE